MTVAKLPLAKDIDDFGFTDTPINEALVHDLATGDFVANQRNVVLIGGTGTGKTHLAIAIARALIRNGIHRRGPWRSFEAVEYATFEWVDWFNNRRLLEPIGNIPPAEAEANFYAALETEPMAA